MIVIRMYQESGLPSDVAKTDAEVTVEDDSVTLVHTDLLPLPGVELGAWTNTFLEAIGSNTWSPGLQCLHDHGIEPQYRPPPGYCPAEEEMRAANSMYGQLRAAGVLVGNVLPILHCVNMLTGVNVTWDGKVRAHQTSAVMHDMAESWLRRSEPIHLVAWEEGIREDVALAVANALTDQDEDPTIQEDLA